MSDELASASVNRSYSLAASCIAIFTFMLFFLYPRFALTLGHALLGSIEARTELLYGLRRPEGETMSGMDTPSVSCGEREPGRP